MTLANISLKHCVLQGAERRDAAKEFKTLDGKVLDRSKVMNASEAGSCIRKQWYQKHNTQAEEQDWGYARRGSHMEDYFVKMMTWYANDKHENGVQMKLQYAGGEQVSIVDKDTNISATPDGVLEVSVGKSFERFGLEFKSIDPRTNKSRLPKETHVMQLKVAMALLNKYVYATKNAVTKEDNGTIKRGFLVYMDASNYNDIIQFEIPCDDKVLELLKPRASKLLRSTVVSNLDREGKSNGYECKSCPFKEPCGIALAAPTSGKANRNSNLDAAVGRYFDIKQREEQVKLEKADCSEEIKQELIARNLSELIVGSAHVALKIIKGRRSLNRKLAEQAGVDLSAFETIGSPTERLEIKQM
jgi:CRISPR/Cas system-associated exonuclease Cas4 (RecB family)